MSDIQTGDCPQSSCASISCGLLRAVGLVKTEFYAFANQTVRPVSVWRWYINITITVLDIIHRRVFYLKHKMDNVRTSQEARYISAKVQPVNAIYRFVTMVY
jgi:hypothetical protein